LLRAAHFLKKVLMEQDGQGADSKGDNNGENPKTSPAEAKPATTEYDDAKGKVKDGFYSDNFFPVLLKNVDIQLSCVLSMTIKT